MTPYMVLLIEHGVEGVVTQAAMAHVGNMSVITEASALLRTLGLPPVINSTCSSALLRPPPPPEDSDLMAGAVMTVEAVTKASLSVRGKINSQATSYFTQDKRINGS